MSVPFISVPFLSFHTHTHTRARAHACTDVDMRVSTNVSDICFADMRGSMSASDTYLRDAQFGHVFICVKTHHSYRKVADYI